MNVTDALARIGQLPAQQAVSTGATSALTSTTAGADFASILASVRGSSMAPTTGLATLLTSALAAGSAPNGTTPLSLAATLQPAALREALLVGAGPDAATADGAAGAAATEPALVNEPAPAGCRCESH